MSAPKCSRKQQTEWLQPSEIPDPPASFRNEVLTYRGAEPAFQKIKGAGLNEELFWRKLWELACRVDDSKPKASHWYSLPGLPLHTLRRFPEQVREWASSIKTVGKRVRSDKAYAQVVSPLQLILKLQEEGKTPRVVPEALAHRILQRRAEIPKLTQLPNLLRLYADCLEVVCTFTALHASKVPARFRGNLEFALVEYVKRTTDEPHLPELATLLTAAYFARGSDRIVDARNLGRRYNRNSPLKRQRGRRAGRDVGK
jgi:hypothetical protein